MILWNLSAHAPLHLFGGVWAIPGYLVWAALIYAVLGTLAAHLIGRAAYLGGVPLWSGSVADEWGASPKQTVLDPDTLEERRTSP